MPITTTGGGGQNFIPSEIAANYIQLMLADRSSLRGHPALVNLGAIRPGSGMGSSGKKFTVYGLEGYDLLVSTAEGATIASETALTSAAGNITTGRYSGYRNISDEMRSRDFTGALKPFGLAMDGFVSALMTLTQLLADLMDGFSNSVGTTTVDFDHDVFMAGKGQLIRAGVPGPYLCILHWNHYDKWSQDLEGRGGSTQWRPATVEQQRLKGPGYQGNYDGVDVFSTSYAKSINAAADYASGMFGRGAIGYAEEEVEPPESAQVILKSGPIVVAENREELDAATDYVTHYRCGVIEIEDGRGVRMVAAQ